MLLRKVDELYKKWFPIIFNIFWLAMSFTTLGQMNVASIQFLFTANTTHPSPFLALIHLFRAFLAGWMFFTTFSRPFNQGFLPSKDIERNFDTLLNTLIKLTYINIWNIALVDLSFRVQGLEKRLNDFVFYALIFISILWSLFKILNWYSQKNKERTALENIPDFSLLSEASQKIKKKLSEQEQKEFAQLVYENQLASSISVPHITQVTLTYLAMSFLVEIAQELLAKF